MLMSVAGKIAMQLNCKLGGDLWAVEVPLKGLMVVGYDTYHDSSKKGQSIGAYVILDHGSSCNIYVSIF